LPTIKKSYIDKNEYVVTIVTFIIFLILFSVVSSMCFYYSPSFAQQESIAATKPLSKEGWRFSTIQQQLTPSSPQGSNSGSGSILHPLPLQQPQQQTTTPMILNLSKNTGMSVYPRIATSTIGNNVYVVWSDNSKGNYDILFKKSNDGGATFGDTINLSNNNGFSFFPQILAVPNSNIVYIVWSDNSKGNYDILFKKSNDGGATFGDTINLSNNNGFSFFPQIAAFGTFKTYVVWADNSTGKFNVLFKRSTDGGAAFGNTINLSNNINGLSVYPRIAVSGTSNNVYVVWADSISREIYFKRSTDGGATFGNSFNLSNNNGLSVYPRIAASTTSNDVYVVWSDNSKGNYDILFKRSTDGGATFNFTKDLSNNDKLSARTGTNITAFNPQIETSGKNVYVVWENHNKMQYANKSDVFMKKSTDGGDTFFGTFGVNLSSNIGASINPQLAISPNNNNKVYVIWQDSTPQYVRPGLSYDIFFKQSFDNGQMSNRTVNLSHSFGASINPQIATSGSIANNVYVVWQDTNIKGSQEVIFSRPSTTP
jgi:hypothetical protein